MLYEEPLMEPVMFEHNIYMALSLGSGSNKEDNDDDENDMEIGF